MCLKFLSSEYKCSVVNFRPQTASGIITLFLSFYLSFLFIFRGERRGGGGGGGGFYYYTFKKIIIVLFVCCFCGQPVLISI